jgi:hypothetical protein
MANGHPDYARRLRVGFLRDGALTLAAVLLAFAALDDITTHHGASFYGERTALVVCGMWFVIAGRRMSLYGSRPIGILSIAVAAAAAVAQFAIVPGTVPALQISYLFSVLGLVWFTLLSAVLLWLSWRVRPAV